MKQLLLVLFICSSLQAQTPLANLANSMQPGSWAELSTSSIAAALLQPSAEGNILSYAVTAAWNPITKQFCFVGSGHIDGNTAQNDRFVCYDDATNTWLNLPPPPYATPGTTDHGYSHNVGDPVTGTLYRRRNHNGNQWYKYDGSWSALPPNNHMEQFYACCTAGVIFPELGGLVYFQGGEYDGGNVYLFNTSSSQWSKLADNIAPLNQLTHGIGAYSAVHHVFVFGQNNNFYKLDSSGSVIRLSNPLIPFYDGQYLTNIVSDPVSGDFIFMTYGSRDLYRYNVATDTWSGQSSTNKPILTNQMMVSAAISNYGVIMYAACYNGSFCHVYIYKHSGSVQPPPTNPCISDPLLFNVTGWPSATTGNQSFVYSINKPSKITLDQLGVPWKAKAVDGRPCTVEISH